MKYRLSQEIVEAFQITRLRRVDNQDWPIWMNKAWQRNHKYRGSVSPSQRPSDGMDRLIVKTRNGALRVVEWDDYIVKDGNGELTVFKQIDFDAVFEIVTDE